MTVHNPTPGSVNAIHPSALLSEGRVYGGGLHKLEPKELANAPADTVLAQLGMSVSQPERQMPLFES
jgi:hypothetical protein